MSFFTQASFVMDPNVYGVGKLYVSKPTDGSGDLTFTRASNGTRVNQDGLIEKVRTNLLTYSNDFSNAAWSQYLYGGGSFVRTYSQADPFGGTTAAKFDISVGTGGVLFTQNFTTTANAEHGLSVWLKGAVGGEKVQIDLKSTSSSGVAGGLLTLTTEWVRYKITANNDAATARGFQFRVTASQISGSETFYVYGAQAETGVPTDYIATTTAAVSVGPTANVPRLNYSNGCPSLLLEPQRTNLIPYSETFDGATYVRTATTIQKGFLSPDGYLNASKLLEDNTNSIHRIYQTSLVTASPSATMSVYVKYNGRKFVLMRIADSSVGRWYNLETGTLGGASFGTPSNSTIQSVGGGWYRITISHTVSSQARFEMWISDTESVSAYQGDVTKGVYLYGTQVEVGSYASSYIPTLGASVTRLADAAYKTGIASLIGQSEGTIFLDYEKNKSSIGEPIWLSDGTYNQFIYLSEGSNITFIGVRYGSQWSISSGTLANGRHKIAAAYKQNDIVLYIDGVQIGTDTSANVPNCSLLGLGYENGTIYNNANPYKQVLLFKTRLSNADLARLTSF